MNNGTVVFYPSGHRYVNRDTQKQYTPVSNILNYYTVPFDNKLWPLHAGVKQVFGKSKAGWVMYNYPYGDDKLERLEAWLDNEVSPDIVAEVRIIAKRKKREWRAKARAARRAGTKFHKKMERTVKSADVVIGKNGIPYRPMKIYCDKPNFDTRGVATEVIVFNDEYDVAGTVDRIEKDGRELEISDYKTDEKVETDNRHQNFKYPIDYLPQCNYNHHKLQLNMYAWMFEQFGFIVKRLTFIHIRTGESYEIEKDFQTIETMLKHWKNEGKSQTQSRESDKTDTR